MIHVSVESKRLLESLELLNSSVAFTRSLYKEEEHFTYNLDKIDKFFLVRHKTVAVGCGCYSWLGEFVVEIKHIFLDPSARGLGAGRKLVSYIMKTAQDDGAEQMVLETTLKQKEAINLYLSLGFQYIPPYFEPYHQELVFMGIDL